jgi:heat shock protein 1/8
MASATSSTLSIGLDIGNTNSFLSLNKLGSVEIIAAESGERAIPTTLAFNDKERLFGEAAVNQKLINPQNTIDNIISTFQQDSAKQHSVQFKGKTEKFSNNELITATIERLRLLATSYSGINCIDTVLTVPSQYTEQQREQYKALATSAGCNILQVLDESIAACIAYNFDTITTNKNVLVFDLGHSSLNLAVVRSNAGFLTQLAYYHNDKSGGKLFDEKLIQHFVAEFKRKNDGLDVSSNSRSMFRLSLAVDKLKHVLSSSTTGNIELDGFYEGIDYYSSLSRARFESMSIEIFKQLSQPIETILTQAKLLKSDISDVLLVGGASRVPRIADIIRQFFNNNTIIVKSTTVNADEAIAYGAAVQAGLKQQSKNVSPIQSINNLTSLTLSIETADNKLQPIIARGSVLPLSFDFTAIPSNKTSQLNLYEGESFANAKSKNNQLIAKIVTVGNQTVKVNVSITADGVITIKANAATVIIPTDKNRIALSLVSDLVSNSYKERVEAEEAAEKKKFEDEAKKSAAEEAAAAAAESKESAGHIEIDDLD